MFENIRKRQAPKKHLYVERPAYIITESELRQIEKDLSMAGMNPKVGVWPIRIEAK